jgi:soluble lytic murein transglycosylase
VPPLGSGFSGDAGLLIDRAAGCATAIARARASCSPRRAASPAPPANPEKFMETMVTMARGAVNDRQWPHAYQIASQVDDLFPAGTDISRAPMASATNIPT